MNMFIGCFATHVYEFLKQNILKHTHEAEKLLDWFLFDN